MKTITLVALLFGLALPASADIENGYYVTQLLGPGPYDPSVHVYAYAINDFGSVVGEVINGAAAPYLWNPAFSSSPMLIPDPWATQNDSAISISNNGDILLQPQSWMAPLSCHGIGYDVYHASGGPELDPADCTSLSSELLQSLAGWTGSFSMANSSGQFIENVNGQAYFYTPVPGIPEPSSMLLLGTVLGASVLFRKIP